MITVKIAFITHNSDPAIVHCLTFDGLSVVIFIYGVSTLKVCSLYGAHFRATWGRPTEWAQGKVLQLSPLLAALLLYFLPHLSTGCLY